MKDLKKIISYILFLTLGISIVFNILFLFDKIGKELIYAGVIILIFVVFAISLLGIITKNIKKEDYVSINIITPVKEIGILYVGLLIIWVITYFIIIIFR